MSVPAVHRGFKATGETLNEDLRALKCCLDYAKTVRVELLHSRFFDFVNRCPPGEMNDLVKHAIATGLRLEDESECERVKSLKSTPMITREVYGELVRRTAKMYAPKNADWWFVYGLKPFRRDVETKAPTWETAVSAETFAAVAPLVGLVHMIFGDAVSVETAKSIRALLGDVPHP